MWDIIWIWDYISSFWTFWMLLQTSCFTVSVDCVHLIQLNRCVNFYILYLCVIISWGSSLQSGTCHDFWIVHTTVVLSEKKIMLQHRHQSRVCVVKLMKCLEEISKYWHLYHVSWHVHDVIIYQKHIQQPDAASIFPQFIENGFKYSSFARFCIRNSWTNSDPTHFCAFVCKTTNN